MVDSHGLDGVATVIEESDDGGDMAAAEGDSGCVNVGVDQLTREDVGRDLSNGMDKVSIF